MMVGGHLYVSAALPRHSLYRKAVGAQSLPVLSGFCLFIYLFIDLSKDAVSSPYYVASNGTMINELCMVKDVEGSGRCLF
jgi:hypothetical protein